MGQFGQQLRRERESRGVALETITGATKISARHLLALEDEKFDALPGGVLSKGIVRGYARVVGLDENDCIRQYLSAYHQSGQIKDDDAGWIEFAENVGRARKGELADHSQRRRWAGVVLLLTLLAAFGWYVAHFVNDRSALAAEQLHAPVASVPANPTAAPAAFPPAPHARRRAAAADPESAAAGQSIVPAASTSNNAAPDSAASARNDQSASLAPDAAAAHHR